MKRSNIPRDRLRPGLVIPAMPLALTSDRKFDERRQRALVRYYIDAGAGGIAVAVHSTQFQIRDPAVGLFEPVVEAVSLAADQHCERRNRPLVKIAGVCGDEHQALREAQTVREHGYHACLLNLGSLADADIPRLIRHCRAVADVLPLVGFYLQAAAGGRLLPYRFWREFAEIENVIAIKLAPFNRYHTLDVVRAVAEAGRENDIALYTGNDDNIVADLVTPYRIHTARGEVTMRLVGGLLGQWAVWTRKAVELLDEIHTITAKDAPIPPALLARGIEVTDCNAAIFDAANGFAGCIPGIHEVLRRQGLLAGTWCLDPALGLSPGQAEEIDRVYRQYPHLNDDAFVREHLDEWLND